MRDLHRLSCVFWRPELPRPALDRGRVFPYNELNCNHCGRGKRPPERRRYFDSHKSGYGLDRGGGGKLEPARGTGGFASRLVDSSEDSPRRARRRGQRIFPGGRADLSEGNRAAGSALSGAAGIGRGVSQLRSGRQRQQGGPARLRIHGVFRGPDPVRALWGGKRDCHYREQFRHAQQPLVFGHGAVPACGSAAFARRGRSALGHFPGDGIAGFPSGGGAGGGRGSEPPGLSRRARGAGGAGRPGRNHRRRGGKADRAGSR